VTSSRVRPRTIAALLALVGLAEGVATRAAPLPPVYRGGWLVVQADLHVHGFTADGTQSPFGQLLQAREHGLQAFAMTNHSRLLTSRVGRWLSRRLATALGTPTVVLGEEVSAPAFHLIALGLSRRVEWDQPASAAIDSVHAQGGVAIAAHPIGRSWRPRDAATLARLDGAEATQSLGVLDPVAAADMRDFWRQVAALHPHAAAVGSSDHHWMDDLGIARTYVFVHANTEREILDALRAGRTVAGDATGALVGDSALVALLRADPVPSAGRYGYQVPNALSAAARACGWLGLVGLVLLGGGPPRASTTGRPRAARLARGDVVG